jgi:hypothetical protein
MSLYFRNIPDIEYISRENNTLGRYVRIKNLFKRLKIKDDIFQNLVFFEKYKIIGDERPDNVSLKIYNDETLDWLILLSNNIIDIKSEWPLTQSSFDIFLKEKYNFILGKNKEYDLISGTTIKGSDLSNVEDAIFSVIHHYETNEIKTISGKVIVPAGLRVDKNYKISYFDPDLGDDVEKSSNIVTPITNYQYEEEIENRKRDIFILKPRYLGVVIRDIEEQFPYKSGGSQFIDKNLKRVDDVKMNN